MLTPLKRLSWDHFPGHPSIEDWGILALTRKSPSGLEVFNSIPSPKRLGMGSECRVSPLLRRAGTELGEGR